MVGIGGIGMSALAQLYVAQGARVTGSDREESPATRLLGEQGIIVFVGHKAEHMPDDAELLVYSDAVPEDNPERQRAHKLGVPQQSYFEALGRWAKGRRVAAVSGTHGKTTTTAMLGKILIDAGVDPTVVVGSIVPAWGSNARVGKGDIFVVEACEYRRHFLAFEPEVLVITNIEWDHTDYFKSLEELEAAFAEAAARAKVVITAEQYNKEHVPALTVPGEFNQSNARAAKAAARALVPEISESLIDDSLASFEGTWRRFEHKGTLPGGAQLIDDYAHHPTAIQKTLEAARGLWPDKKIAVFFHPHLYSRTRGLFDGFAQALALPDRAYILPVYAAREPYDPAATHEALAAAANAQGGHAESIADFGVVVQKLKALGPEWVAITMGAGDVYKAGEAALKK